MNGGFNFARRPFRNERPVLAVLFLALLAGLILLAANVHLYTRFSREVEGIRQGISWLEQRRDRARRLSEGSRAALNNYRLSSLALESSGLQTIVRERRFSWTQLLARLERTLPPEVRLARLIPRFEASDAVSLELAVVGRGPQSVVRTVASLTRDPSFQAVDLRSETSPEAGIPEGYSFLLTIRYVPEAGR